jgi:ABC-type multidrug transport system permease subunit
LHKRDTTSTAYYARMKQYADEMAAAGKRLDEEVKWPLTMLMKWLLTITCYWLLAFRYTTILQLSQGVRLCMLATPTSV